MDVVDQVEIKEAEKHGGAPYMAKIENTQEAIYDSDNQFESSDKQTLVDNKNEKNKSLNDAEHNGGNNNIVQHSVSTDNSNKSQEIWVETLSDNGKIYYYHAITRDTTWIKPDGPKVKIIQQGKKESGDNISQGSRIIFDSTNPMNVPNRNQGPPNNYKNHGTKQEITTLKTGVQPQQQQKPSIPSQLFPPQTGFPVAVQQTNFNGPPFSVPPPGYSSNHHHAAPWGMSWGLPNKMLHPDQLPKNLIIKHGVIDPNIINRAAEWSEHRAPDGRPYYYHAARSESVWDKPQAIRDLEAARIAAHSGTSVVSGSGGVSAGVLTKNLASQTTSATPIIADQTELKTKRIEGSVEIIKRDQSDKIPHIKKTVSAVTDKTRPVSSTPIGGTPWCVVWTGDGRVFFYNPSTRLSVWERPAELLDRVDVDKAINSTPQKNHANSEHEIQPCTLSENQSEATEPRSELDISLNLDIPAKKAKLSETKIAEKPPGDVTKEAAIEAEVRASKERALVPLETRVKSFKEMLREKDVSAFSTWEKELHKIVFDPRYLLLTSRERKQIFDKYVKDRAEEERKEKRNKMRQKRDNFRELLESARLHPKCSFSEFAQKYGKDDKFKAIDKNKERESLFNEFIIEIRKREREEKIHQKEMIKKNFMEMLREKSDITRHSRWIDIKKKIESDSRYRSVDSSFLREEYFMEFCHILKEERKKNKEKTNDREQKKKNKEKRKSEENHAVHSPVIQNQVNVTNTKSDEENEKKQKERDRQLRAEQSIKDREKEVQRSLANHLRDRDKEREHHKRDEAVQHFNALLADLVRNSDLTWKEVKKQLKKDHRWELIENLERESRERFFNEHIESLIRKKRENFREMLDELSLELTCSWKDVKKNIKNDPRFLKYNSERSEREFRDYIKDKTLIAKTYLRELLQESKLITHKSYESVQENIGHLKEIEEILRNDRRYLMLNHMEHERSQIILTYLEDLYKKGPPPPPTATETARRK